MNRSVELRNSAGTRFNGNYPTKGVRRGSPHELSGVRAATALDRRTESAIKHAGSLCSPSFTHPGRFNEPQGVL
jgi:hypothetical protein